MVTRLRSMQALGKRANCAQPHKKTPQRKSLLAFATKSREED